MVTIAPGAVETELLSHTTSQEILEGYQTMGRANGENSGCRGYCQYYSFLSFLGKKLTKAIIGKSSLDKKLTKAAIGQCKRCNNQTLLTKNY